MAVHEFRLLRALRQRPERAHRHARDPSAFPQDARKGGLCRLQRVVASTRQALPGPEALVRDPLLRYSEGKRTQKLATLTDFAHRCLSHPVTVYGRQKRLAAT